MGRIIETHDGAGRYTGHYRLIDIPGEYVDLPGRGGPVTQQAAHTAQWVFAQGWSNAQAQWAVQGRCPHCGAPGVFAARTEVDVIIYRCLPCWQETMPQG